MTKIQRFFKAIEKMAEEVGTTKPTVPAMLRYDYQVETRAGLYIFRVFHDRDEKRVKVYSIVGRFDDVDRAKKIYDCNPYSGKHNFHYFKMDDCLDFFQRFLVKATGKEISRKYTWDN